LEICAAENLGIEIRKILKNLIHCARRDFLENAAVACDVQNQFLVLRGEIFLEDKIDLNFLT